MEEHRNESNYPTVIALSGASGSGKDTIAEYLASYGYERIALADRLKQAVELVFGLSARQLWGDQRDVLVEHLGLTPRELYQRFSDACRALDDEVWTRPFEAQLRNRSAQGKLTVWTDVRTEAELELARRVGATLVRVLRPGASAKGEASAHHTETVVAGLPNDAFDRVIINDRSLASLYQTVDRVLVRRLLPRSVNLHFWRPCNMQCGFCFAPFEDTRQLLPRGHLDRDALLQVIDALAEHGAEKLTLVGGEPTLCPWLDQLLARAKDAGLVTMIVTNGSRLLEPGYMEQHLRRLDWLTLSVDSLVHERNVAAGRTVKGQTLSARELLDIGARAQALGMGLKLNTVVHRLNRDEDLSDFVRELRPNRWKLFQVLPVDGQNHERFAEFEIDRASFDAFVELHRALAAQGIVIVSEANEDMRGSYAMIDPAGRFYDSATGRHHYSEPILEVGVERAWTQVHFDPQRFQARGADYDFHVAVERLSVRR